MKKKLSVCIICKDEEAAIESCLDSVIWADEIVVVDSGSRDKTIEIAKKYTDKVFHNDWPGFGPQRQKAESLASHDWVLALDCDEVISSELREEIQKHLQLDIPATTVFRLNRLTEFCGRFIRHSGWSPDRIARIYNKNHTGYNGKMVHEFVETKNSQLIDLKAYLYHHNRDSWADYKRTLRRYAEDSATEKKNQGKNSSYIEAAARGLFAFVRHYFLKRGFLDGKPGLLISYAQVRYTFDKYSLLVKKNKSKELS